MATEKEQSNLPARRPRAQMTSTGARAHLECTRGPEKGETFRVAPRMTLIGRDASCDVVLSETAISRQHCRIDRRGDEWVLTNLSSNGTRVKKQPIDEHVLSDGDEIRIGAKTRLEFVVEEAIKFVSGRPQFRARGLPQEDEQEEGEADQTEGEEGQPSLFKRRKGLFIGVGAYVGVLLVIAVILGLQSDGPLARGEIPILGIDEMVIWSQASKPLRTLPKQSPEGVWVENELGVPTLIPREDFESGKAKRIPGIRQAIDVQYYERHIFEQMVRSREISPNYPYLIEKQNRGLAKQYEKLAVNEYLVCHMPGKEAGLLRSVRLFQQSLAYAGMRYFPDTEVNKIYLRAVDELIDKVHTLYKQGIVFERAGDPQRAWGSYKKIQNYIYEPNNPIFRNVSARLKALKKQFRKN